MTKVEMEKPVVSKKLAEAFEQNKNYHSMAPSSFCSAAGYCWGTPEYEDLSCLSFETLLMKMYLLGYEIEKPKLKYITLNSNKFGCDKYLNLDDDDDSYSLSDKDNFGGFKTQFTQSEVDDFLKDEPKGMWVVEEVEDQ